MATGGTYTLIVAMPEPATVEVGALGEYAFDAGWYAYVGSALGTSGFGRIDRHRELAAGERDVRHWHIDYLLGHDAAGISSVVRTADVDAECAVADAISCEAVPDFGCSDCDCGSHLFYSEDRDALRSAVEAAHDAQG